MNRVRMSRLLAALLLLLAAAAPALAEDPLGRDTPRGAALGYLEAAREADYARAAEYLDLRRIPEAERAQRGPSLARRLIRVLDQKLWVEPDLLSEDPEGRRDDDLPPHLDRIGSVETAKGPADILLERVAEGDELPLWKVSSTTVAKIRTLYDEFGYGRLGEILPAPFFDIRWLEVALWQWIGLLAVAAVAVALSWLLSRLVVRAFRPLLARVGAPLDEQLVKVAIGPLRLAVALVLFSGGILPLALALPVQGFFGAVEKAVLIIVVTWLLFRIVNAVGLVLAGRLQAQGRAPAVAVVPLGQKTIKVVILALALLALLQNLGFNVTGIVAGLGIGGLAVALAAQKTLENVFGGVTLIADQPVRVGDFCRFGDKIGTVEEIGLRSTRVRTLDRTVVTIPNAQFASLQLENFARRDRIWLKPTLGLRYETTPDQLRYVLVEVRKMLYAHPRVSPEPARIRFVGFGAYSLDLEIFAYVMTQDFGEFLSIREDIYLRIMDIVAASGTGFAFPSSTTYLGRDAGLDEAKGRAAEEQVRAWREQGQLYLPEFPPEAIEQLRETLPYPPDGAPRASESRGSR
jgi:MscS family membrane protein